MVTKVEILHPFNNKAKAKRYKIFLDKLEEVKFEVNLKTVVDTILALTSHNVMVKPILTSQDLLSIPNYAIKDLKRQWLHQKTKMYITDLVAGMLPNEACRRIATSGIIDIKINQDKQEVNIIHNFTIVHQDIVTLNSILCKLLFKYYNYKIVDSLAAAQNNLLLMQNGKRVQQGNRKIFTKRGGGKGGI